MRPVLIVVVLAAAGCSAGKPAESEIAAACPPGTGVTVSNAWVRTAAAGQTTSALYMTICNGGDADDALIAVKSDLADAIEIHQSMESDGVMSMSPLASVPVAHGAPTTFAPGGLHVMLIGLHAPIIEGASEPMTLVFEKAGEIPVKATALTGVKDNGHEP